MPIWDGRVMDAVAAFQFPSRQAGRKYVLESLASYAAYEDGVGRGACPAVESTVARHASVGWRQAQRHVAALRLSGHIKAVGLNPIGDGRFTVIYDLALDDAQRLLWQAEADGSFDTWSEELLPVIGDGVENGHIDLPPVTGDVRPNYNFKTPEVLRTSDRAGGAIDQGSPMPGAGFEREDEGRKPRPKVYVDSGDEIQPLGYLETPKPDPGPQKGAQRRGGAHGELAAHFVARQMEVNPNKRSNISQCAQMIGKKLKLTGVDPTIVERMIDAYWDDPRVRANHRPTQFPHLHFLNVVWEDLLLRVQRSSTTETYAATPAEIAKRNRRLGL